MAQRISRAKATIRDSQLPFRLPAAEDRASRLAAVLHVLYLVFNEGHVASAGEELQRRDLAEEAIRLTRLVHRLLPAEGEVAGLLALMLLIDARRSARAAPDGALIPLAEQDRSLWDRAAIAEGVALVHRCLREGPAGPYQLQAAIAAVHAEAATADATDWPQILGLYELLRRIAASPVVALNHAIAVAMVHGAPAGLARLDELASDLRLASSHRLDAVRAHLLEMAGDDAEAIERYRAAARMTRSTPEQRYLRARAAALFTLGAVLLESKKADCKAEGRDCLEAVIAEYGELSYRGDSTYGVAAEGYLFELDHLQIGMQAPDFETVDENGVNWKLSDYRGKVVVVDFWGFW